MSDATTTQALVLRVQQGDNEALCELYSRYVARVLTAVRVRLGAELRAKMESWDVVQDAMLASLRNVESFEFESEGAFLKWLTRIVENRIRDHADFFHAEKRDQRREKARSDADAAPLEIDVPTPSQILALREDMAQLESALDALPDESRELIVATKLEGRSYVELAGDLDRSPDAVRMQVNRAMVMLTKQFQENEGEGNGI